ncbi:MULTISPECIES: PP2C family protein-serine/threonine phosphatase [Streptomyces]|uniref:PP2C family protein-serine/threonine phosphatase n=1 Tax=Streptomyces TaxID=1883 RepID=UPI00201D0A67|nr:PP2C family protein-serine/threonine phosphatase [Streptomyces panaciradicis]MCL6674223.1 serine/threonine-protein phosphatase [Streptomyces panaciradicis]
MTSGGPQKAAHPAARTVRHACLLGAVFALIVSVTVVDILTPPEVHLGPFLVAAPAVTASFAGPRLTGFVGAVAVLAQATVAIVRTSLTDLNHTYQIIALTLISALATLFASLREREEQRVARLRSIAHTAQNVVLRPLPERAGPLVIASLYLAAQEEAHIGGDLYAAARTANGTRLLIGDAKGKGLDAVSEASLVLGAFRVTAGRTRELPELIAHLDAAVGSAQDTGTTDVAGAAPSGPGSGTWWEAFVTALVLEIPDDESVVHIVSCGHPPPLLLRDGRVLPLDGVEAGLPLGLSDAAPPRVTVHTFPFGGGDALLLYTDGVIETRNPQRNFYPLTERLDTRSDHAPQALIDHLKADLKSFAGGHLGDDAAFVAVQRLHRHSE